MLGFHQYNKKTKSGYHTRDNLFDGELQDSEMFQQHKSEFDAMKKYCSRDVDLALEQKNSELVRHLAKC